MCGVERGTGLTVLFILLPAVMATSLLIHRRGQPNSKNTPEVSLTLVTSLVSSNQSTHIGAGPGAAHIQIRVVPRSARQNRAHSPSHDGCKNVDDVYVGETIQCGTTALPTSTELSQNFEYK